MKLKRMIAATLVSTCANAWGASAYFTEPTGSLRFEQYLPSPLAIWRMPTPGTSTFPGGTCRSITISGGDVPLNRFFSLYLFLKANGGNYFMYYDTGTCQAISFGIDG
jgi:hypothetical protein